MSNKSSLEDKKLWLPDTREFIDQKWLYVHELKELLSKLDDDMVVQVNRVENLAILSKEGHKYLGYIDFLWKEVELEEE